MNEELANRIQKYIVDQVEGGVSKSIMEMLDEAIEDDLITQDEFDANEMSILDYIDGRIFECVVCGWTQPTEQMGEDLNGELRCGDCDED